MASHKAEFYVQLVQEFAHWDKNRVTGVKAAKITQNKPDKPLGGSQVVRLVLDVDEDLFLPKTPNIVVSLTKQNIAAPQIVEQEVLWQP